MPQVLCSQSLRTQVVRWNNIRRPQSTQQSRGCRPKSWQQLHHCWRWEQQLQIWDSCSAVHGCTTMHWKSRAYLPQADPQGGSWLFFWDTRARLEMPDSYSDSQSQQGLFFYLTWGHKAAQQEEESLRTLAVMRKSCMSWGSSVFTWSEVKFQTLTCNKCMWEEKFC